MLVCLMHGRHQLSHHCPIHVSHVAGSLQMVGSTPNLSLKSMRGSCMQASLQSLWLWRVAVWNSTVQEDASREP
jgi:hypothetical protein